MKLMLGQVVNAIPILQQIRDKQPNFKIDYWIMRNMKALADANNFFMTKREDLYEKYCSKIKSESCPRGSYWTILENGETVFHYKDENKSVEFLQKLDELINMPCEDITPYKLSIDVINNAGDFHLDNRQDIYLIDFLLSE